MLETRLFVRLDDGSDSVKSLDELALLSNSRRLAGVLHLNSSTRLCLVGDTTPHTGDVMVDTGDRVEYYKEKLYFRGRTNKILKINGILTNLDALEKVSTLDLFEFKQSG
jgi:hypothetical protein